MPGNTQVFQDAMDQGHSAAWDGSWDLAVTFYRQALDEFPDHPQALVSLGLALFELGSDEQALKCYLNAARLTPEDPMPIEKISQLYERLGNQDRASQAALHSAELYLKNRDPKKAVEVWERALRLKPDDQKASARLAAVYERIGEKDLAVREYLALASLQQAAGNVERAAVSIERALVIVPGSPQALRCKSLLQESKPLPGIDRNHPRSAPLRSAGRYLLQEPPDLVQAQVELNPVQETCQAALAVLAGLLFESAEMDPPLRSERLPFKELVKGGSALRNSSDHTRLLLYLSQVIDFQTRSEFEKAAEELQRAVDIGLVHPAAQYDLGFLYSRVGRQEEALRQLLLVRDQDDFALGAHLLLGSIYRQMDQEFDASMEYLEALKLADMLNVSPQSRDNLRQQYDSLVEAYRLLPALEVQARLSEDIHQLLMRPDWRVQVQHARSQLADSGLPRTLAEMLAAGGGNQLFSTLTRVRELKNARRLRSAMEEVFYALEIAPLYLPLHTLMADLLVDQGEIQRAIEKYRIVARVYSMRGESSQAIALQREVIKLAPADIQVRNQLISEYLANGQVDEAALELMKLAEIYMSLADLTMARNTYTNALNMERLSQISLNIRIQILHRIADIDLQSLDWRQAVRSFEQIRTLQPHNEEARRQLVSLYFRLGQENTGSRELAGYLDILKDSGRQRKVLPFLEELARDFPANIHIRQQLAEAYHEQGHTAKAVAQLDWIGEKLLGSGDRSGAIACIKMIIALDPPNKSEYELLLSQLNIGKA